MAATFNTLMRAASRLNARARAKALKIPDCPLPPILFVTDPARTPDPLGILRSLPKSADGRLGVIYRHFGAENRVETARALAKLCKKRRFMLLIGADPGLAAQVKADGVHLPERMSWQAKRLAKSRPHWIITAAAHSHAAVKRAQGTDAVLVSPVFETASSGAIGRKKLGVAGLNRISSRAEPPIYGLGGVNTRTIKRLRAVTNVWGVALATGLKSPGD